MCVTNTVNRRSAVKLPAASLSSSTTTTTAPSMLSQRLFTSLPEYVESYAAPKASTAAMNNNNPSAMMTTVAPCPPMVVSSSSDSEHSYPQLAPAPSSQVAKRKRKRKRKPQLPGKTAKMNDRHFVVHNYHDHALDVDVVENQKRRGGVATAFPLKLHAMLAKIEEDGLAHVVSWQPHGRCFVVHQPKVFCELVMPKYFKQTRLTSFQRQLNLYGFNRITKGRDNGGYYHELFLRGKEFLSKRMTRTKVKGTKFKAASSPDSEPDFYQMPFVQQQQPVVKYEEQPQEQPVVYPEAPSFAFEAPREVRYEQPPAALAPVQPVYQTTTFEQPQVSSSSNSDTSDEDDDANLMIDFVNMWDAPTEVPTRLEQELADFELPDGCMIENDAQLGELLEALLEE